MQKKWGRRLTLRYRRLWTIQPHSSQYKPVSCQLIVGVFSRHVVSRTRISFEQGKNLSHLATTRGKGKTCNTTMAEQAREYVWGKGSNWIQLFQINHTLNVNRSLTICFPLTMHGKPIGTFQFVFVNISACELSKEKPTFVFSFKEEDEDEDYLIHTLFLKNVSFCYARFEGHSCMQPFCHVVIYFNATFFFFYTRPVTSLFRCILIHNKVNLTSL